VIPSLEEAIVVIHLDLIGRIEDIIDEAGPATYWGLRLAGALRGEGE
jgi:hypothetical protein